MGKLGKFNIKTRVILPLAGVFLLLAALVTFEISQSMSRRRQNELDEHEKKMRIALANTIENHTNALTSSLKLLKQDGTLLSLWNSGDRRALFHYVNPLFNILKNDYHITHLYFIRKDRKVFLRIHKAEEYGDFINRYTLLQAQNTKKSSSGVELGPLGTLTLRVVLPVFSNNALMGYIEMGQEMDQLYSEVRKITGDNIYVVIYKKFLDRQKWEEGMKMLNYRYDWDLMDKAVIVQQQDDLAKFISTDIYATKDIFQVKYKDRIFMERQIPMLEASGRNIGQIVVFFDVTEISRAASNVLFTVGGVALILVAALVMLIFQMLVRVENELGEAHKNTAREEQKRLEEQELFITKLHDSKERYRKVLEILPIGVTVHARGKILFANDAILKMVGLNDPIEVLGKPIIKFIHSDFRKYVLKKVFYNTTEGTLIPLMDMKYLKKDGTVIDVEVVSYHGIYDGEPAVISISRDISERIRLEHLRADTERIVHHDMKNPLTGIIGFSKLLYDDLSDPSQKELAGYINATSHQLLRMLNRSLDLFKMEEGAYEPDLQVFDLGILMRRMLMEFRTIQESKNIAIECQFFNSELTPDSSHLMYGDELYIEEMLGNLIRNALEASPPNEIININIEISSQQYRFDIHNSGVIPSSIRDTFFDRYSTSGKKGGTGIGTFSSRLIARANGGDIHFTSSEKEGTHLIIVLPVRIEQLAN